MKTRDRGLTPTCAILTVGVEAVHREGTELKADTASAFHLVGEGSSKDSKESMDTARIISNNFLDSFESEK